MAKPRPKSSAIKLAIYIYLVYKRGFLSFKRRASFVLWAGPVESLILFEEKNKEQKTLYFKSGELAQKEKKQIQPIVNVGDHRMCPECRTISCVVWVSQDKKTMGVQCHKSHGETSRPASKYGATFVPSTKTRKNIVFLTAAT